jgi:glucose/mannose transport system substrate-binding protein
MAFVRVAVLLGLGTVLGVASALQAAPREATTGAKLTIYHWWTSPSETAAFQALVDLFSKRHPEVGIAAAVAPSGGTVGMFPVISELARAGRAPGSFQLNAGYAMQPFIDAGLLEPIDALWASEGLDKVFSPVIRDLNKFDGRYYSVPIGVHRKNVIWYNQSLLAEHGIDADALTTWDAFFKAAEKLEAKGIVPIQASDTTAAQILEGIMASRGVATYEDWINGRMKAGDDPRMLEALRVFKKYLGYANHDHADVDWATTLKRVMKGAGAFCLMGDWANGEFRLAGMTYGKEYRSFPVPGTEGMFGLSLDTFQHPVRSASADAAKRWLRLASSREAQDAFNPVKGSIPARNDADLAKYDAYQRASIAELRASKLVYPAVAQGAPTAYYARLVEVLTAFMSDRDVAKAASALAATTVKLSNKYIRVWSLE